MENNTIPLDSFVGMPGSRLRESSYTRKYMILHVFCTIIGILTFFSPDLKFRRRMPKGIS